MMVRTFTLVCDSCHEEYDASSDTAGELWESAYREGWRHRTIYRPTKRIGDVCDVCIARKSEFLRKLPG